MWVDASCRPEFAAAFDVDLSIVPAIVAIQRKKGKFAKHLGSFTAKSVKSFVSKVLGGKQRLVPYSDFPLSDNIDCAAKHSEAAAAVNEVPEEDDIDMDELMAEIRAEEEAANVEADQSSNAVEDELQKAKEEKARKEMEKLMAKSNKKKSSKKKRRKRRRKRRQKVRKNSS